MDWAPPAVALGVAIWEAVTAPRSASDDMVIKDQGMVNCNQRVIKDSGN